MSTVTTLLGGADECSSPAEPARWRPRVAPAAVRSTGRDRRVLSVVASVPTGSSAPSRPAGGSTTFSRYLGGTYPSTVEVIRFADGTQARTDLVRLHPNIAAYSIDYAGVAPGGPSRYRDGAWASGASVAEAGVEGEVVWIMRHSFPTLGTAELSRNLRVAGVPIGSADLKEHEAIAGTQAAIWHLTNGMTLDTQPLSVPVAVSAVESAAGTSPDAVLEEDDRRTWRAVLVPGRETFLEFEFDGRFQLGEYAVELGSWTTPAAVSWRLQSSSDRRTWRDVSSSEVEVEVVVAGGQAGGKGGAARTKALGVGATLSDSVPSRGRAGYRYYRLAVRGCSERVARIEIRAVRFTLADSPGFRNGARVVHLYRYLLAMATAEVLAVPTLSISGPSVVDAAAGNGLAGPFYIDGDRPAKVRVAAASGGRVVDRDGRLLRGLVRPGQPFYVDLPVGGRQGSFTLRAAVGPVHGYEGRALVGARSDDGPAEFTTLARAVQVWRHAVAALDVRCNAVTVTTARLAYLSARTILV
jgi:TQXA domain-containing protein